jgi:serine/threonine-protein kinase RsbW
VNLKPAMSSVPPHADRTLEASLPSSLSAYQEFIESLLAQLTKLGWQEKDLFAVRMALEESISNAIRHGNKEDPAKSVQIECQLSPTRFWIQITDEGVGFNPAAVPDCRTPDRLEVPGGRGLTLMKAYMTKVEYKDCGNRLVMEKLASPPDGDN